VRIVSQNWLTSFFRRSHRQVYTPLSSAQVQLGGEGEEFRWPDGHKLLQYVQAFLGGTNDCVLFLDSQWRFTFLNKRASEELRRGFSLIGAKLWDAFPEALGTPFEDHYRRAMKERSLQVFEAYFAPLAAWYEVHAIPVENGLTVIFRNINEQRAASEALRERERQLNTVFGQTVVGIMHRDLDRRVLMVNQRYCEIVGRSREELDGLPMQAFTHPDDHDWNTALFQKGLGSGEPFQIEKRYTRPDGSSVWCAVSVSFVRDDTGKIVSMITVAEDISDRKQAEEKFRESRDLLQVVIDSVQDLIFVKDREGRFVFTNRQLTEACGPLDGLRVQDRFSEDLSAGYENDDHHVLTTGEASTAEEIIPVKGEPRTFQTVKVPWRQDGEITGVIGVSRDLTERLAAEAELVESRRQLATLIDSLPGLVYRCSMDAPWPFSFLSEGAAALTGYTTAEFIEQTITWGDIVHPDDFELVDNAITFSIEGRSLYSIVYRIITRSGEIRWVIDRGKAIFDAAGKGNFLEGIIDDITIQKEADERIRWIAHHDPLTKLPNRLLFQERLEDALQRSQKSGRKVALLLLDVDHLKEINDTMGHDAGDAVLQAVATRLGQSIRGIDTVARNGGDEFAIILPEIASEQDVQAIIGPALDQLNKPFVYAGRLLDCRASIGVSIWPDHAKEASSLMKQADVALYTVKSSGRGKMIVFEPSMRSDAQQRTEMRNRAREAIDARRIEAFYQPKVHLDSGKLAGFEALLRWRNHQADLKLPGQIQAAFEDPNLAVAIGQQMQELVFTDMRRWLDAGVAFGHVAINASPAEFRGPDFADRILEGLRNAGIPTRCLELEVTETVFLGRGSEFVGKALRTLSAEGVKIALDDFGTGYASLSHLKQFPVDIIKIDRSFVQDLANSPDDTAILQAVLNLGRNLGITTVAEGVETAIQAEFLRAQNCDLVQGYLFGRAAPNTRIPELVSSWDASRCIAPYRHKAAS
jgi:diguanylate cyclase (GGDEF)-like protein/PAS domain S-box-containing protein